MPGQKELRQKLPQIATISLLYTILQESFEAVVSLSTDVGGRHGCERKAVEEVQRVLNRVTSSEAPSLQEDLANYCNIGIGTVPPNSSEIIFTSNTHKQSKDVHLEDLPFPCSLWSLCKVAIFSHVSILGI